ncbi:hypothetical protein [Klebsiella sp. PL-2018]|uniref:hypothetical protein n=1 Tax=Klebsiella sp. PL-2018 TaxID=2851540 RepID=UPI001C224FB0|nr:hypothetical protein [Klebsiella sp. PL-2018]QXD01233.1 hypothetical protein MKleb_5732 [Klebsiella sp. PL-2018]
MKIKDMYIVNVFFLFFAFAYHLLSGVSGLGVLLMSLLAPQIIAFMPLFFYSRLGGMMEACGAKKIRDIEVKPNVWCIGDCGIHSGFVCCV